ncbi:hypothetical protein [Ktedonobacter robiniae]|uniref:Uncharacterized protein n=1 Tax=Ktedonobacter robiniae TaxID=2778365 RepID=A0ABQ3V3Y8_9CHLR|nr:hypothetical protein [Ktedonobacter robiniae]GHO59677.1 hypothetical protein KSB_81520 [Ktedonobacter robiniae]
MGLITIGEAQYDWAKEREQMTTIQELQEIVEQFGLINLHNAMFHVAYLTTY